MAGKSGMKHLRGRTQEEKDAYALGRIEQFIDTHLLYCEGCKSEMRLNDLSGAVVTLLAKRYDKLRANPASTINVKSTTYINDLSALAGIGQPKPAEPEQAEQVH